MPHYPSRLVTAVTVVLVTGLLADARGQQLGELYVEAMSETGQPVLNLGPRDFSVQDGEIACEVLSAQLATTPMRVALLVDNSGDLLPAGGAGIGAVRDGLNAFLDTLPRRHEIALVTIGGRVQSRRDFTTNREALKDAVRGISLGRGLGGGSTSLAGVRLLDGVREIWEGRFTGNEPWPVFVLVLNNGVETSFTTSGAFEEFFQAPLAAGVQIHTVLVTHQEMRRVRGTLAGRFSRGASQRRALGEFVRSLAEVTGGLFSTRDDPSELKEALTTLATRMGTHYDEMSTFYRVTVRCPESRGEGLFVGVSRLDVSLRLFPDRRLSP